MDDSSSGGHGTSNGAAETRRERVTAEGNPRSPRELTPQLRSGAAETGMAAVKRKSPNRVHFTPDITEEDTTPPPPSQQQQQQHAGDVLEEPIPPRRPLPRSSAGDTSFTPNSYTPTAPSPAPARTATQHYGAPTHGGPADVAKSGDTDLLEQAMAGATWERAANLRLNVLADFEPCCSVELRVYQGQFVTGLFRNGAWVYVRASNGAEGYLPTGSCALARDGERPPSIDVSSSGVSSVGTGDDDVASTSTGGGRSSSHSSSLDRVVTALERGGGVSMTSPDGRTSGYSSEPEKASSPRVKFAPTASILQPGYRNVHIPEEYVAMYPGQRPRAGSTSTPSTTTTTISPMAAWQASRVGGQQRAAPPPPSSSAGNGSGGGGNGGGGGGGHVRSQPAYGHHYGTVPGSSVATHHGGGPAVTRARNMSYPMDRQYPGGGGGGNSPLAMSAADQRALAEASKQNGQSPSSSSSSSRSRRLIDRLRNFRSSTAPASMDVFDGDGSNVPPAMSGTGGSPSGKESKKDVKRRKQQKKPSSSSRQKEYVTSDSELTSRRIMPPLAGCRAAPMTDSELSTRQMQRLDLAGLPVARQRAGTGHRSDGGGGGGGGAQQSMANAGAHPQHRHQQHQQQHRQQQQQQQQQQQRYPFASPHPRHVATNPLLSNPGSRKSVATSQPSRLNMADDNDVMMVTSFVLYDFEAQQDGQLSVKRGQPVWKIYTANDVIKGGEVGWIFVMDPESKQKGFIPQACLQPLPSASSMAMSRAFGIQKQFPAS